MKSTDLEAKVKKLETQQKKSRLIIKQLEARITQAEDIEAIKKLQRHTVFTWNTGRKMSSSNYFQKEMTLLSKSMTAVNSEGPKASENVMFSETIILPTPGRKPLRLSICI